MDLDRVFQVLMHVLSFERHPPLGPRLQKELAVNMVAAISAVRHRVTSTHNIMSGVRSDVVNTAVSAGHITRWRIQGKHTVGIRE